MTTSLRKGCIGLAILLGYFLLVSLPCPDGLSVSYTHLTLPTILLV